MRLSVHARARRPNKPAEDRPQIRMPWSNEPEEETRTGEVLRVLYEGEESSFRVLLVERQGQEEKWVGTIPKIEAGQSIRATGQVEPDKRKPGETVFRVDVASPAMPDTTEGMVSYLGSGAIEGIGPILAKRIVDHFGRDTLTILDSNPERLAEVSGIGPEKRQKIIMAWAENRAVGAIMMFLHAHGATAALANRIYARYGSRAIEIIKENPYQLALDVPAIGFKTADKIARASGVELDSPARTMAGILQVLHDAEGEGHLYCEKKELLQEARALLGIEPAFIEEGIAGLLNRTLITQEPIEAGAAIFRTQTAEYEAYVARRLHAIVAAKPLLKKKGLDAKRAIDDFEKACGMTLAPAQREAVTLASHSKILVLTGGPGTGKTSSLRALLAMFRAGELMVRLCAPTGRAAKRMSEATGTPASTIHRTLSYDRETGGFLHRHSNPIPDCDVLIVDEASMVDIVLAAAVLDALPDHARLVIIGDRDQLPSVGPGAFLADVIASGVIPTVRLSQVFRQAEGSPIVDAAHRINAGLMPEARAEVRDGGFFFVAHREAKDAAEKALHLVLDRIPQRFRLDPRTEVQVLTPMHKGDAGTAAMNRALQEALNRSTGPELKREGGWSIRVGDRVMQTKNDSMRDVWNGDLGFVTEVNPESEERQVVVQFDERAVIYAPKEVGGLRLAYASSIHKSQGGEYPAVVILVTMQNMIMLSRNLIYTAVTRGKRLAVIVGDPAALRIALAETRREERRTLLAHRIRRLASS